MATKRNKYMCVDIQRCISYRHCITGKELCRPDKPKANKES